MSPSLKPSENRSDELTFSEILRSWRDFAFEVSRQRSSLRAPLIISLLIGVVFAFAGPVEFQATTRLIPYRSGASAPGLQGLAGLAGIRLPANSGGEAIIASEFYPEVARTLDFRISVAETPVAFSDIEQRRSAAKFFDEVYKPSLLSLIAQFTIGLPGLVVSAVYEGAPRPTVPQVADDGSIRLRAIDRRYERLVHRIGERISVSHDKKSGIVTVGAEMPDPLAAADLAKVAAQQLMQSVVGFEVRRAEEQLVFVEAQFRIAKARHETAQRELAVFADRNRMLMSAVGQLERMRLEREAELAFDLYQQLARETEQARLRRSQDTPTFSVLDQVTVPNRKSKPRRLLLLVLAVFLGLVGGLTRVAWRVYVSDASPSTSL